MDVVLTTNEAMWKRWADQYVKRQPTGRKAVVIADGTTPVAAKDLIISALTSAGVGGQLVFSVGHGVALDDAPADGLCELTPGGMITLVGRNNSPSHPKQGAAIINVFYDKSANPDQASDFEFDTKENPASQRLKNWALYQEIAKAMRTSNVARIVLLTCRLGNATDFLQKIASDWGVKIMAYKKRVACIEGIYTESGKAPVTTSYVYLEGEVFPKSEPTGAAQNVKASEEIPDRENVTVP
jgi:hypothetical protein